MDALFLSFQQVLAGRYSIDREIGRGGMGVVYLAREVHLDRLVAIKLLPPELAAREELRERFLSEVRLAAKLSHPNIIPIHSIEETGDFVYFVMTFVDGQTLTERVRSRGPLAGSEAARVLRDIAWALSYAHAQGFVHRDIKPDNILIENASGRVLIADFGIASAIGQSTGDAVTGTPEFMSPEQVLGRPVDARSDIYSLGATGFFAVTGRLPFEGDSPTAILAKHVSETAPTVASMGVAVPRKVALVIDRCLMKAPTDRFSSANDVASVFSTALEQRRELPAALRAFVKRGSRLNGGGTLVTLILILPAAIFLANMAGGSKFVAYSAVAVLTAASVATYFVAAARSLLRLGYSHADLPAAFKAEAQQVSEELAIQNPESKASLLNWLKGICAVSAISFGLSTFVRWEGMTFQVMVAWMSSSVVVATLTGTVSLALMQERRDVDTEFWGKLWSGRIGRAAFAIAKWFRGKVVPQAAMTHRATELSLGLAAEQLYESLPKATRAALGPVPTVLQRLQQDAQGLRSRMEELSVVQSDEEIGVARERIGAQLRETVGALETIRLDLLRLHAGAITAESFTTHLDAAAEVSRQVARLVEANRELGFSGDFPRLAASTPV